MASCSHSQLFGFSHVWDPVYIWIGLSNISNVTVAAHREEIRFHEVALQFPEGAEARRTEPPAAPGDDRRRGGRAMAPTTS